MSPSYPCQECNDDHIIGLNTIPCIVCAKRKIGREIQRRFYFGALIGTDITNLPNDVINIIVSDAIHLPNIKNMIEVHNCCWRTNVHDEIYTPHFPKPVRRRLEY